MKCIHCGESVNGKYISFCNNECIIDYVDKLIREDRENKKDKVK